MQPQFPKIQSSQHPLPQNHTLNNPPILPNSLQLSSCQLLRYIESSKLSNYLTPVKQRKQLGYIQKCCQPTDPDPPYNNFSINTVGLDCQMIQTSIGAQLIRVTILTIEKTILYNQWFSIKQATYVTDYLTHITGITQQSYKTQTNNKTPYSQTTKNQIQKLIHNKIIIGHDLANDLKLLDITHQYFIDTVALLPHHFGLPYKNKLKDIAYEYLRKYIQWGVHDPVEDILAALEIVEKHIAQGRGIIQTQQFLQHNYVLSDGSINYQQILQHVQLRLDKTQLLILRGSRALSIQIQHAYKSDWDFVLVYNTPSTLDGRLIKLPNVDISFFDKVSFERHLKNNDISYLEIFFMPSRCQFVNKIEFPYLGIDVGKLRVSLDFHLNKIKMKIRRYQKQLGLKLEEYYQWKIVKSHHLAVRFMDLFVQIYEIYGKAEELDNYKEVRNHYQKTIIQVQLQIQQKNQHKIIENLKTQLTKINIFRSNPLWHQIQKQFIQNKNYKQIISKLVKVQKQKMTHINKITNFRKMETLRYRDKTGFIGKGNRNKSRRGIKGGLQENNFYKKVLDYIPNQQQQNQNQHKIMAQNQHIKDTTTPIKSKTQNPQNNKNLQILKFLSSHNLTQLQAYNIFHKRHKKYPNLLQLHYMQSANFNNIICRECRGIIIDQHQNQNKQLEYSIVALPYYKFFDYNDGKYSELGQLDWESTRVYEKKDGSIAFLYYYNNSWQVASSTIPDGTNNYCFAKIQTTKQFSTQFWSVFYSLGYKLPNQQDRSKTFIFQLMSKDHIIVVKRTISEIYLHGVRDLITLQQQDHIPYKDKYNWLVTQPILELKKQQSGIKCIVEKVQKLDPLKCQGYILCDKNYTRVKVKNSSYVRINWLGQLNLGFNKDPKKYILIQIILSGEAETFIKYCPEWQKIIKQYTQKIDKLNKQVIQVYENLSSQKLSQKQFAQALNKYDRTFRAFVFAIRTNPQLYYGKIQNVLNAKKFYTYIQNYQ